MTSDSASVLLEVGQDCIVTAHAYRLVKEEDPSTEATNGVEVMEGNQQHCGSAMSEESANLNDEIDSDRIQNSGQAAL